MRATRFVVSLTLASALACPGFAATKAELEAKAAAVVNSPQAAAARAKAAAALSDLPAQAAKFRQGLPKDGAAGFTPEQMQKIQSQAGQAFSNIMTDPQAAAAAAQGGISPQALQALHSQSAAAVAAAKAAGSKGAEGAAAAGQKAQEFMKSDQAAQLKGQANEALSGLKADPKFKQSADQFKEGAQALTQSPEFQTGVQRFKEGAGTAVQNLQNAKTHKDRGTDPAAGYVKYGTTQAKAAAAKALVQFCKKFEDQPDEKVPAKCKKPKLVPVKQ